MRLCFDLVEGGYITPAQALSVLDQHLASRTPIGQLAVEDEHMTMSQVFDVLAQQTISNRPFGELAIELGYLDRLDLGRLLLTQSGRKQTVGRVDSRRGLDDSDRTRQCGS